MKLILYIRRNPKRGTYGALQKLIDEARGSVSANLKGVIQ